MWKNAIRDKEISPSRKRVRPASGRLIFAGGGVRLFAGPHPADGGHPVPAGPAGRVENLKEMNFGSFEGRNYVEMEHDPDYLAWVKANCETTCPDGERKDQFCDRTCAAFAQLVDEAFRQKKDQLVIVAHGGTQMAVMERYAVPHHEYYHWCAPNAGGYKLDASRWPQEHILTVLETVQYTKGANA